MPRRATFTAVALAAAILFPACDSASDDSSTSTTKEGGSPSTSTSTEAGSSTTSTPVALVLRTNGLGALTFGMSKEAAQASGLIGPEGPGCELAGTTGAGLLAPLEGSVTFGTDGRLEQVDLRSGATTAEGVAPDATVDQVMQTYDGRNGFTVERDDSTTDVFGVFLLNVSRSGAGYSFVFDEGASNAHSVAVPAPAFCD